MPSDSTSLVNVGEPACHSTLFTYFSYIKHQLRIDAINQLSSPLGATKSSCEDLDGTDCLYPLEFANASQTLAILITYV